MNKVFNFFFLILKPPNPVDHHFDGSSKKFNLKKKILHNFEDIINFENNLKFKLFKLL